MGKVVLRVRLNLYRSFYISAFLIFTGLLSTQVHADGIESVNSYVEIKSSATDFRARKESTNGQRSTSGFDFIIAPERTDICQQGRSSYFSDYSSISNNDLSSSDICFLELMLSI